MIYELFSLLFLRRVTAADGNCPEDDGDDGV
jgi:hypothetical protein